MCVVDYNEMTIHVYYFNLNFNGDIIIHTRKNEKGEQIKFTALTWFRNIL